MKGKIEIEFEYDRYEQAIALMHGLSDGLVDVSIVDIKRVTVTCYDTDDKPFMTETPIGSKQVD